MAEDEGSVALDSFVEEQRMQFSEIMSEKYDIVSAEHDPVGGSYVVLAERRQPSMLDTEIGGSSPSPWTNWTREEWVSKLRDREGLIQFYRMKRSDGAVRGALRMLKTPIQSARWYIKPASDSARDKNVAKFIQKNIFEDLNVSWSSVLDDILLMCEYGYMVLEKVFTLGDDGKIHYKKLAPRHPLDVREWEYDINGGPDGVLVEPLEFDQNHEAIFIPIQKLAVFVLEAEAGDLRGISVLRSAYKHWYYKDTLYKIDAIQKERHGIGVPVIILPQGYTADDKKAADNLGRNLRTNERAHVVLPPNWQLTFAEIKGQPVDCLKSIDHHNMQIFANVLAPFIEDANGVKSESTDMFMKSTRYIADMICDIFNRHIIRPLVDMNWSRVGYPCLRARRIGEWDDARTQSFAVRNYVGAGIIVPDDELEKSVREDLDLPPKDEATARAIAAPQNPQDGNDPNTLDPNAPDPNSPSKPAPPKVGPPRQAPTPPVGFGTAGTGRDRSGNSGTR